MGKHRIIIAGKARVQLLNHISFLSKVSVPAARQLRDSFAVVLSRLKENPYQFPIDQVFSQLNLPYRKALFDERYKVLFTVEDDVVFIDSVVDCRQQTQV